MKMPFLTKMQKLGGKSLLNKIKKEIGDLKDIHGLAVFVFNRIRMYAAMFGIAFLVLERFFAIMGVDLGISEYLVAMPTWAICLGLAGVCVSGLAWMYVDLKFIVPSERRSSTKRDPIIREIWEGIDELRSNLCSDSELQQRTYALPLVEAIGKTHPKDSSGR